MLVKLGNTHAIVASCSDEERRWLTTFLSFNNSKAWGSVQKIQLYNLINDTYPAGLHPYVADAAEKRQIRVDAVPVGQRPCSPDLRANIDWLHPYQRDAVDAAVLKSRGILQAATGSGKTEMMIAIMLRIPCHWLFLVHRQTLVNQFAERFELRTGDSVIRLQRGKYKSPKGPGPHVFAATFQTMMSALRNKDPQLLNVLRGVGGIFVDEVHTVAADTFYRVTMQAKKAHYRIGCSATPLDRTDQRSLMAIAAIGPIIYRIKSETLMAMGAIARPKIRMVTVNHPAVRAKTYHGVYGETVVRSTARNLAVIRCARRAKKPCILFVKEIDHGKRLLAMLTKQGVKSEFVWGDEKEAIRMAAKKRLEYGDIDVLVASVVFQEGVDVPNLESVVVASSGKSVIAALQRIGRGSRTNNSKKMSFEVFDILDRGHRWLEKHTQVRMRAYRRESYELVVDDVVLPLRPAASAGRAAGR